MRAEVKSERYRSHRLSSRYTNSNLGISLHGLSYGPLALQHFSK